MFSAAQTLEVHQVKAFDIPIDAHATKLKNFSATNKRKAREKIHGPSLLMEQRIQNFDMRYRLK